MRVLVIGGGRLGRALAHDLLRSGHHVTMLDADAGRIARIPPSLSEHVVHGSALVRATLDRVTSGRDAVVAVTTDDAFNAVVACAARRELAVPMAIAVIGSPARAQALAGLGVHIVCPTSRAVAEIALTLVRSDIESELQLGSEAGVYRVELPSRLAGRALGELALDGQLLPIALERDGRVHLARASAIVEVGDVLHVAAEARDVVEAVVHP
jgi:trk system potassium uptake protein TrkA